MFVSHATASKLRTIAALLRGRKFACLSDVGDNVRERLLRPGGVVKQARIVEYQDVVDVLNCQADELTTEELQEEAEGREEEADNDENQEAHPRQLTTAILSRAALETAEQRLQWLEDNNCNAERRDSQKRFPS
ncbi:hypothetical protein M513_08158 [Trichuris suis]|uniref:Uncharacterized protein n=1 Tax=Trichuris suis TaxID=68888 RepID=A0A085M179_9BILA|nr:hypothetical protein M513_08158 [Trichuris suis]